MNKENIRLYDTYENKVRPFKPLNGNEVDIYYCGPTVYNYVHLGNFRPTVTFDLLSRFLTEAGYEVKLVSNYTDIDDKIIKESIKEGKSEKELSEFYIKAYEDCLDQLNIKPLYCHPKASEYIDKMVDFIGALIDNGSAYKGVDDIYFSVRSVEGYGNLSKQKIDDLDAGKRIEVASEKKDPLDFALWKLTDDEGIKFDTPIGKGRPGWHTECVVMVNDVFHKPIIDIHGGGFDLKFPHHENEIAQSEALNHTRLANYWMHVGFLLTDGVKMSKSLGNSTLAKDVLERYSGNAVRLFFLSTHYRAPVNYTEENLQQAEKQINKYQTALNKANFNIAYNNVSKGNIISEDYENFMNALADDLNGANALTVIDRLTKEINTLISKNDNPQRLADVVATLNKLFDIFGFRMENREYSAEDIQEYNDFQEARRNKYYAKYDILRKSLT